MTRAALFVVPDWHGAWPLEQHPGLVEELRRRQAVGAEVLLHGYRHDEAGHTRSLGDRLLVFGRTAGSAEFMMLAREEAARRMDRGLATLRGVGLEPVGFVPPAWLFGDGTVELMRERGLHITEGFWRVHDVRRGRSVFAPALSWSTARAWRSLLTAGIARVRGPVERGRAVVRVAIHPPDIERPVVARSLERTLVRLVAEREVVGYREALGVESGRGLGAGVRVRV